MIQTHRVSELFFLNLEVSSQFSVSCGVLPGRFVEPDPSHTLEERVVHWYFAQLDNNGSQDISKKELKPFKRYLKKKAKPKKCARRFSDYCDLNRDKAISLSELKGCLGVTKESESISRTGERTVPHVLVLFYWPIEHGENVKVWDF